MRARGNDDDGRARRRQRPPKTTQQESATTSATNPPREFVTLKAIEIDEDERGEEEASESVVDWISRRAPKKMLTSSPIERSLASTCRIREPRGVKSCPWRTAQDRQSPAHAMAAEIQCRASRLRAAKIVRNRMTFSRSG